MANQSPDRRKILEMMANAAVASQFPGFSRWAFAHEHHEADKTVQPRAAHYQPQFYSPVEYQAIAVLTEMIIPADESPGAKEAGVSEFIDFMAAHGEEELQKPMQAGLKWLQASARKMHGDGFLKLPGEQQADVLKSVAYGNNALAPDPEGTAFFELLRRYTVMGYYTSRVGLQELDYPGLKFYTQSPECPHKDDPEHRHLPAPKF